MAYRAYCNFIVVLMLIMTFVSCSSEEPAPFPHHYNISSKLFAHPTETTTRIIFGNAVKYAPYLLQGWSKGEAELRWADSRTAELGFYHNGAPASKELKIRWKSLPSQQSHAQKATLFLNGKELKTFTLKPEFSNQKVRLPASSIFPGFNLLSFQFSSTEEHEGRELAAAFEKIQFSADSSVPEDVIYPLDGQDILQQAGSGIGNFLALPERFDLEVEYQVSKGAKAYLEVVSSSGERQTFKLSSGETHASHRFSFPEAGFYRIHAVVTGKAGGAVIWKQLIARTDTPQAHLEEPSQSFVKQTNEKKQAQDILLYVIDTLRADHVGCYGYERETTPKIDAFAAENALYANAYATSSWTKPSGASILTGLMPHKHHADSRDAKLPDELITLGELLQEQGYYTAAFITNGSLADYFGFAQGFDTFIYFPEDNASRKVHTRANEVNEELFPFLRKYQKQKDRKPLFLLIWTTDPHDPYTPPEDVLDLFDIQQYEPVETRLKLLSAIRHKGLKLTTSQLEFVKTRYDQEIFANDRAFGDLLDELKALNLYEEMTLVLTADHGDEFLEHGGVGHSLTLYNEQIRIPFVVKSPEIAPGNYEHAVQITDIYPTILESLGIDAPYPLDGVSLLRPADPQRVIYTEVTFAGNDVLARQDTRKKLILNKHYSRPPTESIMPVYESYAADDLYEQENLTLEGFEDFSRVQDLASYTKRKNPLGVQREAIEISPELDQKLRELGYAK